MTAGLRESDGPVLRSGFSYRHLEVLAWRAVRDHTSSQGLDLSDRFEAACGAVVECLCAPGEQSTPLDLMKAGLDGVERMRKGVRHERGY